MGFWNTLQKTKVPDTKQISQIPSKIKTESKKIDLNTVDVIYVSNDYRFCNQVTGQKIVGKTHKPIISLTLPDNLKFFGKYPIFNKTTNRELYIIKEDSPYDSDLSTVSQESCKIKVLNDDKKEEDFTITQSLLNELGNFKMIEDINEKANDGFVIIFIMGLLVGSVIMSIIMGYILS